MKRKDMQPGVLYAIGSGGMYRPGLVLDASTERIRARIYWSWPAPEGGDEQDYLDPYPAITDERSKYDDKIVKTMNIMGEWTEYAKATKADRAARLQARLDQEAAEAAQRAAEIAERTAQVEALSDLLQDAPGYVTIENLLYRAKGEWSRDYFSARDIVILLEHVAAKVTT